MKYSEVDLTCPRSATSPHPNPITHTPSEELESEVTEDLSRMYDLYGLGDIAEISFNLLDSSPEVSLLTFCRASPSTFNALSRPTAAQLHDFSTLSSPYTAAAPLEDIMVSPWIASTSSKGVFAHPSAQIPDKMMYTPTQYNGDRLSFPDYMMVHSNSGLPVLMKDQPADITSTMPYPSSFYHFNQGGLLDLMEETDDTPELSAFHHSMPDAVPQIDFSRTAAVECKRSSMTHAEESYQAPKCKMTSSKNTFSGRKRGRPRKEQASLPPLHMKLDVASTRRVEEKENRPAKEEEEAEEVDSVGGADEEEDVASPFNDTTCGAVYPKPPYSYSALVTLALKNSKTGRLTVRDIYNFMCNHFPYFRTAPSGWKNSVRHNLSLNPAFLKIVGETGPARARTACRWTMNPERYRKMNDEVGKFRGKALSQILKSMRNSDLLKALEEGSFSDFSRAIKGVTVQEKKAGQRRRKLTKKKDMTEGEVMGRPMTMLKAGKDDSSMDSSSHCASSLSYKPRSPLVIHPSTPVQLQTGGYPLMTPLHYSKMRRVLDGCWEISDTSENCDPEYSL